MGADSLVVGSSHSRTAWPFMHSSGREPPQGLNPPARRVVSRWLGKCWCLGMPLLRPRFASWLTPLLIALIAPLTTLPPVLVVALLVALGWGTRPSLVEAQTTSRVIHSWKRLFYGNLNGEVRLLFADRIERAKPTLGDIDGDGAPDLLLGVASGRIMVFLHQGSGGDGRELGGHPWRLVNDALPATQGSLERGEGAGTTIPVDVGENAAPALVDLDDDDDLDLLVGNAAGKLLFYRNEGNRYLPRFYLADPDVLGHEFGGNLVPRTVDIDSNGIQDLSIGTERGEVYLVANRGTRDAPHFCLSSVDPTRNCPAPPPPLARLEEGDNAAPDWVDWDGDGDLDLLVGKSDGRIAFFRNIGTNFDGLWELASERFLILDAGGYAAPLFRDLDGDGWSELILAWDGERIPFYHNRPRGNSAELWLVEGNLLGVARLGRAQRRLRPATGDLDGDGRADLVLGSGSGQLLYYRNLSQSGQLGFAEPGQEILPTPKRTSSAPALGDLDGDGDLDLLVGGRNGRLELVRNIGTVSTPAWRSESLFYNRIDVGNLSVPRLWDLDGDGDLDLLVGNSLGNVVQYENQGDAREPNFVLGAVRFGGLKVTSHASPAVFSWDPQQVPDIVTGSGTGALFSAVRNEALPAAAPQAWVAEQQPWQGIGGPAYSAPKFVDFSDDGHLDLLLGTGPGTLALWRYEGSTQVAQIAKAPQEPPRPLVPDTDADAEVFIRQRQDLPQDPIFEQQGAAVGELTVGRNSFPTFVDLDGDGALDLVVGTAAGELFHFKNLGPPEDPEWELITRHLVADHVEGHSGRNAAPAFWDVEGDGDQDLFVGYENGKVSYWENIGSGGRSEFALRPEALGNIHVGQNAVPLPMDLNGDSWLELLVGNLRGELYFYRHREGGTALDFELVQRRFVGLDTGLNATPTLGDITIDGVPELLVGSDRGAIIVLQRTGTDPFYSSGWRRNEAFLEGLDLPPGSHPAIADLDGDGDYDLFVGSDAGPVRFFRNQALVLGEDALSGAASQPPR